MGSEMCIRDRGRDAGVRVAEAARASSVIREKTKLLVSEFSWRVVPENRLFHVKKDKQKIGEDNKPFIVNAESIIETVTVPAIESFFEDLKKITRINDLEVPPLHATLYVRGSPNGIGLNTSKDFDLYVAQQIENRQLDFQGI